MSEINENTVPSLYSDFIYFDYCYDNASMRLNAKNPTGGISALGTIKMSPQTLKALKKSVDKTVEEYENIYGTINDYDDNAKEREKEAQKKFLEKEKEAVASEIDKLRKEIEEKRKELEKMQKEPH